MGVSAMRKNKGKKKKRESNGECGERSNWIRVSAKSSGKKCNLSKEWGKEAGEKPM